MKARLLHFKDSVLAFLRRDVKAAAAGFVATVSAAAVALPVMASGSTQTVVTSSDWQAVTDALTKQISVSTVVAVLAVAVGASVGFVFMWWGVRKVIQVIMSAVRGGRENV